MNRIAVAQELVRVAKELMAAEKVIPASELAKGSRYFRTVMIKNAERALASEEASWTHFLKGMKMRRSTHPKSDVITEPIKQVKLDLREDFNFDVYIDGQKLDGYYDSYEFYG